MRFLKNISEINMPTSLNHFLKLKNRLFYLLFLGLFFTCIFLLNKAANNRQLNIDTLTLSEFNSNLSTSPATILKKKILSH